MGSYYFFPDSFVHESKSLHDLFVSHHWRVVGTHDFTISRKIVVPLCEKDSLIMVGYEAEFKGRVSGLSLRDWENVDDSRVRIYHKDFIIDTPSVIGPYSPLNERYFGETIDFGINEHNTITLPYEVLHPFETLTGHGVISEPFIMRQENRVIRLPKGQLLDTQSSLERRVKSLQNDIVRLPVLSKGLFEVVLAQKKQALKEIRMLL